MIGGPNRAGGERKSGQGDREQSCINAHRYAPACGAGGEGVDEKWLAEMRRRAPGTKILPRVSLELDRFQLALLFGGAASHALSIG